MGYYEPRTGRFGAEDPYWRTHSAVDNSSAPNINAISQSTNLYAYCLNNPVLLVDPLGLESQIIIYSGEGNAWYGHIEIAINGIIYTFGNYGAEDEKSNYQISIISPSGQYIGGIVLAHGTMGPGILVKTSMNEYLRDLNGTRQFVIYDLNLTAEQEAGIVGFYESLIAGGSLYDDRSASSGYLKQMYHLSGKYSTYDVLSINCATMVQDALWSAVGYNGMKYNQLFIPTTIVPWFNNQPSVVMSWLDAAVKYKAPQVNSRTVYKPGAWTI